MQRRPPESTLPDPHFPCTPLCRFRHEPRLDLHTDHAAAGRDETGEERRRPAGAGTDVEDRVTGSGPEQPEHVRHRARLRARGTRSEEHTSELQSLMRISYAVFCLKKKKHTIAYNYT